MAGPDAHKRSVVKHRTRAPQKPRSHGGFAVGATNVPTGAYIGRGMFPRLTQPRNSRPTLSTRPRSRKPTTSCWRKRGHLNPRTLKRRSKGRRRRSRNWDVSHPRPPNMTCSSASRKRTSGPARRPSPRHRRRRSYLTFTPLRSKRRPSKRFRSARARRRWPSAMSDANCGTRNPRANKDARVVSPTWVRACRSCLTRSNAAPRYPCMFIVASFYVACTS